MDLGWKVCALEDTIHFFVRYTMHRVRYILRSTYGGEGFWNWVFRASNCVDSGYARVQDLLPPVDPTDSIVVNVSCNEVPE